MPSHLEIHPLSDQQKDELIRVLPNIKSLLVPVDDRHDMHGDARKLKDSVAHFMELFNYREKVGGDAQVNCVRIRKEATLPINNPPRIFRASKSVPL
ncbi:hypothetical protein HYQ46_003112 [Verticillium longisporum]|nr:hypothetical protein HYQ46_003112 [Verticillium longisporum]